MTSPTENIAARSSTVSTYPDNADIPDGDGPSPTGRVNGGKDGKVSCPPVAHVSPLGWPQERATSTSGRPSPSSITGYPDQTPRHAPSTAASPSG
jgi:hypothetical protein